MLKRVAAACLCVVLICLISVMALTVSAEEVTNEREYKPLDLVVVVDGSGSMLSSDPDRTAPAAIRMLVNMMPAETSRVGIISFNTEPTVLTKDTNGDDGLISLETLAGLESIRDANKNIRYNGDTGIGNAVYRATQLLDKKSDAEHAKAIMLFTDGINDFGYGPLAAKNLADCDNNENSAIMWAKENNCPIYCIGYNYKKPDGTYSMGNNGEGLLKLTGIAEQTGGTFSEIQNVEEAEDELIVFLADVCDIVFVEFDSIPGDGNHYDRNFTVSPSVVEANIRIKGGSADAISNGSIVLVDPSGNKVDLKNSDTIRVDQDATAESIKILRPTPGEWTLSVDGYIGDEIKISSLEHFKMNLTSELVFPEGNPKGVAYTNDTVLIRTWVSYDGKKLEDERLYDTVTSAKAICTARLNPDDVTEVTLKRNGTSFEGSFTVQKDSYYDVLIRLDWDNVYREDTLPISSTNKPLYLVKDIEDVTVNKGKDIILDDIYQYVADEENDPITATVSTLASDVVDCNISGDKMSIKGVKGWWASTLVTVTFTDKQGNKVETTFNVFVQDIWAWVLLIGMFVLIVAAVITILIVARIRSRRIKGDIYIQEIMLDDTDNGISELFIYDDNNPVIMMSRYTRDKNLHSIKGIIKEIKKIFNNNEIGTPENTLYNYLTSDLNGRKLLHKCEKSKIIGTLLGDSFFIKLSGKTKYLYIGTKDKGTIKISNNQEFTLCFKEKDPQDQRIKRKIEFKMYFRSPVRTRIHTRKRNRNR